MSNITIVIQGDDKTTGVIEGINNILEKFSKTVEETTNNLVKGFAEMDKSVKDMHETVAKLGAESEKSSAQTVTAIGAINSALSTMTGEFVKAENASKASLMTMASGLTSLAEGAGGAASAMGFFFAKTISDSLEWVATHVFEWAWDGIKKIGSSLVDTNSQYELYAASLESIYTRTNKLADGSANFAKATELANETMQSLFNYARDKPFTVEGLTAAYRELQAFGMEADNTSARFKHTGQEILDAIGNVKSANPEIHASIDQLAMWFGQASEGNTRYLREFLTNSKITRDELIANGVEFAGTTYKVTSNMDAAMSTILDLIKKDDGQAMYTHMQTLDGLKTNLKDFTDYFERTALGPVFQQGKEMFSSLMKELWKPESQAAVENIKTAMTSLMFQIKLLFGGFDDNKDLVPSIMNRIASSIQYVSDAAAFLQQNIGNIWTGFFIPLKAEVEKAFVYGENLLIQFSNGIVEGLSFVVNALGNVGNVISDLLMPRSPPKLLPALRDWGKGAMDVYMQGWTDNDFKAFDQIRTGITDMIKSIGGDASKVGAIQMIMGTQTQVAAAIAELDATGNIAQGTFDKIRAAAGAAGGQVVEFVKASLEAAKANKEVADQTKIIAEITDKYKDQLTPLTAQLAEATYQHQKLQSQVDTATASLKEQLTIVKSNKEAYDTLAQIDLEGLKDKLDEVKQKQLDLKDAFQNDIDPLKGEMDRLSAQEKEISNAERLRDINDQINGTGIHANDMAHAKLAVQLDINQSKEQELRYEAEIDKLGDSIAKGKAKGKDMTAEELQLEATKLKHSDDILKNQEKLQKDQDKVASLSPGGAGNEKAVDHREQLESQKQRLEIEGQIKARTDKYQDDSQGLKKEEHSASGAVKEQEETMKARDNGFKAQEQGLNAQIKRSEEAHRQELDQLKQKESQIKQQIELVKMERDHELASHQASLEVAKAHKTVADEHLKILQDQNKVLKENFDLATQMATAEKAASAGKGKAGPNGGRSMDDAIKDMVKEYTALSLGTGDPVHHGAVKDGGTKQNHVSRQGEDAGQFEDTKVVAKKNPFEEMADKIKGTFDGLKKEATTTFDGIEKKIGDAFTNAKPYIDDAKAAFDTIKATWISSQPTLTTLGDGIRAVAGFVRDLTGSHSALNPVISFAQKTWKDMQDPINAVEGFFGRLGTAISNIGPHFNTLVKTNKSLSDAWDKFNKDIMPKLLPLWDAFKEAVLAISPIIGIMVVAFLTPLMGLLGGLVGAFSLALPYAIEAASGAITVLTGIFKLISQGIQDFWTLISDIFQGKWGKLWDDVKKLFEDFVTNILTILGGLWQMISNIFLAQIMLVVGYVWGFVMGIVGWFQFLYDTLVGHSIIPDLVNAITKWFNDMVDWVTKTITGWVKDFIAAITDLADKISSGFQKGIDAIQKTVTDFTTTLLTSIGSIATQVLSAAEGIGKNIADGVRNGLEIAWKDVTGKLGELGSALPGPLKDALKINSPSLLFAEEVGMPIPEGLAHGIEKATPMALDAITAMSSKLTALTGAGANAGNASSIPTSGNFAAQIAAVNSNLSSSLNSPSPGSSLGAIGSLGGTPAPSGPTSTGPITVTITFNNNFYGGDPGGNLQNSVQNSSSNITSAIRSAIAMAQAASRG